MHFSLCFKEPDITWAWVQDNIRELARPGIPPQGRQATQRKQLLLREELEGFLDSSSSIAAGNEDLVGRLEQLLEPCTVRDQQERGYGAARQRTGSALTPPIAVLTLARRREAYSGSEKQGLEYSWRGRSKGQEYGKTAHEKFGWV